MIKYENSTMSKSVCCTNIPKDFIQDKKVAKQYFQQFGRIHRFILRPRTFACTVEYETQEEAMEALNHNNGLGSFNGHTFEIRETNALEMAPRQSEASFDPDVLSELEAMTGGIGYEMPQPNALGRNLKSIPDRPTLPFLATPRKQIVPQHQVNATPSSPTMVQNMHRGELEELISMPALTAEQRHRVLDARDRLLRLNVTHTTDLAKIKSMRGSCPDMCPEKERWMREAKHQVASFEMVANQRHVIDHRLAVKQYSRSSADQEMPHAHELRSEPVLRMTMAFLLHEIADLCDSAEASPSDWYHFLWDRTRSIRKDITQQELCCQGSVILVEQCARFHIHCAARLVAEEPMVFDQKINTENLTKCLQSLKYLYHDLRLRNERCPNEAEFRAYIVLLNLQDSNFLWEIKQLPVEIRRSPAVRFAVDVYLAIENNNYVQFFKLVRRTTYLNACILLRYFNQVRTSALATIVKAYTVKSPVALSTAALTYTLAFEDTVVAEQFFEYHGLQCDPANDRVYLDRANFCHPSLPFALDRAVNVVEQKRMLSVGDTISGNEMYDRKIYENHQPQNSFDNDGYLKSHLGNLVQTKASPVEFKIPSPIRPTTPKRNSYSITRDIERKPSEIASTLAVVDPKGLSPTPAYSKISFPSFDDGSEETHGDYEQHQSPDSEEGDEDEEEDDEEEQEEVDDEDQDEDEEDAADDDVKVSEEDHNGYLIDVSQSSINAREKRKAAILSELVNQVDTICEEILQEQLDSMVANEASRSFKQYDRVTSSAKEQADNVMHAAVVDEVQHVVQEECLMFQVGIYAKLKLLSRTFKGWRRGAQRMKEIKERVQMAPMWVPSKPLTRMAQQELQVPHQDVTLTDMVRYKHGQPTELAVNKVVAAKRIDIVRLMSSMIADASKGPNLSMKFIVSIPTTDEEDDHYLGNFIEIYLKRYLFDTDKSTLTWPIVQRHMDSNKCTAVNVCVELAKGIDLITENGNSLSQNHEFIAGVFFFLRGNLEKAKQRLDNLQRTLQRTNVPIVFMVEDSHLNEEAISDALDVDVMEENALILARINRNAWERALSRAIAHVVDKYEPLYPHLKGQYVRGLVKETLGETFWMRLQINGECNVNVNEVVRNQPSLLGRLYNEAVGRMIKICCSDFGKFLDWPAEFQNIPRHGLVNDNKILEYDQFPTDWRAANKRLRIADLLESMKLPPIPQELSSFDKNRQIGWLYQFLAKFFDPGSVQLVMYKIIQAIGDADQIIWLPIFNILTTHLQIKCLVGADPAMVCIYDEEHLGTYLNYPWWLQSTIMKRKFEREEVDTVATYKRRKESESVAVFNLSDEVDNVLKKATHSLQKADSFTRNFNRNRSLVRQICNQYDNRILSLNMTE